MSIADTVLQDAWRFLKKKLYVPIGILIIIFVIGAFFSQKTFNLLSTNLLGEEAYEFQIEQLKIERDNLVESYDEFGDTLDSLVLANSGLTDYSQGLERDRSRLQRRLNETPTFTGTPDALADSLYLAWQRYRSGR